MVNVIVGKIEALEEQIESIKWLLAGRFFSPQKHIADAKVIARSSGLLGKHSPRGIIYENKIRKEWQINSGKRIKYS